VLVAIVKKRLGLAQSLSQILQVLSLRQFEKTPIKSLFDDDFSQFEIDATANQLNLLDIYPDATDFEF